MMTATNQEIGQFTLKNLSLERQTLKDTIKILASQELKFLISSLQLRRRKI